MSLRGARRLFAGSRPARGLLRAAAPALLLLAFVPPAAAGAAPVAAPAGDAPETVDPERLRKLEAYELTEEVKKQILSWASWAFGPVALILALLGIKTYTDLKGKLSRTVEAELEDARKDVGRRAGEAQGRDPPGAGERPVDDRRGPRQLQDPVAGGDRGARGGDRAGPGTGGLEGV